MTSFLIERERCFLQPRGECKYLTTPTAEQYLPTHEQDKFFLTPVTAAGLPEKTHATFLVSAEHKYDEAAQVNPSVSVEQASSTPSDQKKVQLPLRPVYVYSDEDRKEAEEEQEQSSHYSTSKFKLKQVLGTKDEHSELKAALRNMGLTRSQAMRALKAVNYSSANDAANWHFANGGGSSAHNGSSNNNASRRPRKPNSVCVWIEGSGWYDPRLPNGYAMQRHGGKPYFINHVKRTTSWDDPRPLPRGFRKQGKFFRTPQGNRTKIDPRPAVQPGTTDFHKV
ncbi:MAG: hypothetical protein MHM6MM_007728 [Cercozoa sp. M6MM]